MRAPSARSQAEQLLTAIGPKLLLSLQSYLGTQADRSAQERFPYDQTVHVQSLASGQSLTATLRDLGRDGGCLTVPPLQATGTPARP